MVSLKDITDQPVGEVEIRGSKVPIVGLDMEFFFNLIGEQEDLKPFLEGSKDAEFNLFKLLKAFPQAAISIAVAGMGNDHNNQEERAAFRKLATKDQIKLLRAIIHESFGDELDPLIQFVKDQAFKYFQGVKDRVEVADSGKGLVIRGQRRSKESLRSTTTPEMFGSGRQENSPPMQN